MKHTVLVAALGLCVGCSGVDKTKLEPVYRSAKALEASTGVGVTYLKFTELLQQLRTEVAIARDKASNDAERALVARYVAAIPIYKDSATLWALKIEHGSILSGFGAAAALAERRGLSRESSGTIDADAGIRAIWAEAAV